MAKKNLLHSKQDKLALIFFLGLLFLVALFSFFWLRKPDKTITNPEGTIGNTAGNLNNYGLFCEYNGKVYFSNSFDEGALYCMNADETEIRRLSNAVVQTLLAGGEHLYYFQSAVAGNGDISNIASKHGFIRTDLSGKQVYSLSDSVVVTGQLIQDYLYLVTVADTGIDFFKIRCDKTDSVSLANYTINPACVSGQTIYYNGTQDNHYLYALDTTTDIPRQVLNVSLWYPVLDGDYLYYMDVPNNYRLCRYHFPTEEIQVLTQDRIDCFNVGGGYIYYQKNGTDPQLKCMRTDGTDVRVLANGNFTRINMTSRYVYFQEFESRTLYHCPLGSDSYTLFTGAQNAAAASSK